MKTSPNGFLLCPQCGQKTKTKVIPGTTKMTQFPLFCPWCHKEHMIDFE